jgi:acyl CoA:acetate/3-ketoacid CoA transferase beta subunit
MPFSKEQMARRAAAEIPEGSIVNLGVDREGTFPSPLAAAEPRRFTPPRVGPRG